MCFNYWFCEQKLTPKTIKIFIDEFFSKPPENNHITNQTDVYHIDDLWSLDTKDTKVYGPEKIEEIDTFW